VQSDIKRHDFVLIVARQVIRLRSALRGNCQLREHLLQFSLIFKHHQQTSLWHMMVKVLVVVVMEVGVQVKGPNTVRPREGQSLYHDSTKCLGI
jgi:hypothetical protein